MAAGIGLVKSQAVSGEMEIMKRSKRGIDARVALLGPGDWFGEMSIVDVQPRSATVSWRRPTMGESSSPSFRHGSSSRRGR